MLTKLLKIHLFIITLACGFVLGSGLADAQIILDPGPHSAVLHPTTNAPAAASGFAWLGLPPIVATSASTIATDSNLHVTTIGLLGGVYTVSITDDATNTYVLGTFMSPIFTNGIYALSQVPLTSSGTIVTSPYPPSIPISISVGNGTFPLPDGVNKTNVVGVSVADSNAVVDLDGTFPALTNIVVRREFRDVVFLAATNDAPAGATGRAELFESIGTEANAAMIAINAEGLLAGTYTVNLTDKTGTNTFVLGDLAVNPRPWITPPGFAHPDFIIFGGTNTSGRAQFSLPEGLDATNAAAISVVDTNGVIELVGDFTRPTITFHCGFHTFASVFGGPLCTNLHGNAGLEITVVKGRARNRFSLLAQGAPASQKLSLLVNGVNVGTTRSTRQGTITLRKLPKGIDLMDVMTVEADDSDGNTIFTADF